jgi:hypothetical protein
MNKNPSRNRTVFKRKTDLAAQLTLKVQRIGTIIMYSTRPCVLFKIMARKIELSMRCIHSGPRLHTSRFVDVAAVTCLPTPGDGDPASSLAPGCRTLPCSACRQSARPRRSPRLRASAVAGSGRADGGDARATRAERLGTQSRMLSCYESLQMLCSGPAKL